MGFGKITHASLHHFSDASADSYGQVSYLRIVNNERKINCRLMMGKSRVAPAKRPTIPRLELTAAAVVSTKVARSIKEELDIPILLELFWTDSQVVLAYISNEVKRFHLFVANRVKKIRECSDVTQWKYVPTKENPADDTTRGLKLSNSIKDKRWINGPEFLYKHESDWPKQPTSFTVCQDDKEVRKIKCHTVINRTDELLSVLEKLTSKWLRMKRVVATTLSWRRRKSVTIEDIQTAENAILRLVQARSYFDEVQALQLKNTNLKKSSQLSKLCPFIDNNGILRIGGRVQEADVPFELKHPIILPRRCTTSNLIIEHHHRQLHHAGRNATLNCLRSSGFWVINGNSLVRFIINKCVKCKFLRGRTTVQRMANLAKERLEPSPPFTYCGVDLFGPFIIRERRSDLKRYAIIFTCLNSRAVHLECVYTMNTDSFIMCLRRFIGRRGAIRTIRCDNGSNFVGAKLELQKAVQEMDVDRISNYLLNIGTDFISWKHNPPYASNFGGVWERLIRSARAILNALMLSHGHSLNDESFRTLLVEVEAIINSRPLTTDGLNDPDALPLSPINLLTMKSKVICPPPGSFQKEDLYCQRRWRRVQHLSNEFWSKWRKEYLQQLQSRTKWTSQQRNMTVGDVVIVKDDNASRNVWKLGVVTEVHPSADGDVRSVSIRQNGSIYQRPVNKLVLLVGQGM